MEGICRVLQIRPHQLYGHLEELYREVPGDLWAPSAL
jgi:hypothetical protein